MRVVRHDHPTVPTPHHSQRHLQLLRAPRAGVRHAAINADFRGGIKAQAQAIRARLQAMLNISLQAFGIEAANRLLVAK